MEHEKGLKSFPKVEAGSNFQFSIPGFGPTPNNLFVIPWYENQIVNDTRS